MRIILVGIVVVLRGRFRSWKIIIPLARSAVAMALLLLPAMHVAAESTNAISQGFQSSGSDIAAGALVSNKAGTNRTAELANLQNASRLLGIAANDPLVALSQGGKEVQVVINGTALALVSDINGSIQSGDKITTSPINGVGMLATVDSQIVGTAQANFNTKQAKLQTVRDKSGATHSVHIGTVPVQVSVTYYPVPTSEFLPPFIQDLANSIAGRPVAVVRILIGTILLLLAFVSIFALLYTATRASITSIGRNPLAASAIRKGLLESGLAALLILTFSLVAIYLILTV